MSDIDVSAARDSKLSLLLRVTLLTAFQMFLCLGLSIAVYQFPFLAAWLTSNLWLLGADLSLIILIFLVFQLFSLPLFRGFIGTSLLILFIPAITLLYGGMLPVLISMESFIIGLGLLFTVTAMGYVYLIWQKPTEFKAHVVIPVGLMVSLALYGGLLIVFQSVMTGHLMLWTFIEGGYIIYISLDLQDISLDNALSAADYVAGTIRINSDVAVYVARMFQKKTVGKGK